MSGYQIRAALKDDVKGIYDVFRQAEKMHRQAHPEIFRVADKPSDIADLKDYFLTCIRADEGVLLVADRDGEVIGVVLAWMRQTSLNPLLVQRTYLNVSDLVVADAYRKLGVGKALMEGIHVWAGEHGIGQIELTVWAFNRGAQDFYAKLGYEMLNHRMRKELP